MRHTFMDKTENTNVDTAVADAIAVFGSGHVNTADASAISQLTYAIYQVVPHSAQDEHLFALDNIKVVQLKNGKFTVDMKDTEQLDDSSLIPSSRKLLNFKKDALIANNRSSKKIPEHIQKQKEAIAVFNETMNSDSKFSAEMHEHLKSIYELQKRGFKFKNYTFDFETNHGGLTLWHEPSKSAVFAHRGSEKSDWAGVIKDWVKTDGLEIVLMGKRLSRADEVAIKYVDHQFNELVKEYPDIENVVETGHSKGGRESQNAAAFLSRKIGNYMALRQVAYDEKLTKIKPPKNINLTALTFNSARVRTVTRLVEWANKIGHSNFVAKAFSNTLKYVSSHFEKRLNKRIDSINANDQVVSILKGTPQEKALQEKISKNSLQAPVKVNHLNISYADLQGKRADPVSNVHYGMGHIGQHIVIKHPKVDSIFAGHLLDRTQEIVQRSYKGVINNDFNPVFAATPVKTLVESIQQIPDLKLNTNRLYSVAEINQECQSYLGKFSQSVISPTLEVDMNSEEFKAMGSLDRLKVLREAKLAAWPAKPEAEVNCDRDGYEL